MKKRTSTPLLMALALGAGLFSVNSAHAALVLNPGGWGVYDTDLNITWLADPHLARSNTFGVSGVLADGRMNWHAAQSWIGAMNAANYLGYNDWRLPTSDSCYSYNCTGSEMGHLFYNELGGTAGSQIWTSSDPDLALFQNVQSGYYWSGTEYAPIANIAWYFHTGNGVQSAAGEDYDMFAWAVRPGQVAAVPEPETYAMLLAGLGLLGFTARRRRLGLR